MVLNNGLTIRSRRNQKVFGNKQKWTHNNPNPKGHSEGSPESEVQSNTVLLKKIEKSQINNLIPPLQEIEKEQQTKPRASRRKELIKIGAELNYIETKRTIQQINKFRILVLWKDKQNWQAFNRTH